MTTSRSPLLPLAFVVIGMLCQEVGAAFAVLLFPQAGAIGMVTLRVGFSAIVLGLIARPRLRDRTRADWLTVLGFAAALVAMNSLFYLALARIDLGTAVTLEILGPIVLALITGRRRSRWLWAVIAVAGVALLGREGLTSLDPVGVALALGAGVCWAFYILGSARTGAHFSGLDGLALAMMIGAVVLLPFGLLSSGGAILEPHILGVGLLVALLSSTIPYALEMLALRRIPAALFSMLMSLGPALAATAGFLVLGQDLGALDVVAIVLVMIAAAGAVRSGRAGLVA